MVKWNWRIKFRIIFPRENEHIVLFMFLAFKLIINLFGAKAWYFDYGKCFLVVWLCLIL